MANNSSQANLSVSARGGAWRYRFFGLLILLIALSLIWPRSSAAADTVILYQGFEGSSLPSGWETAGGSWYAIGKPENGMALARTTGLTSADLPCWGIRIQQYLYALVEYTAYCGPPSWTLAAIVVTT